ncbi:CIC11C00000003628 [Sungouiella intermedia]|uniref:CIC11C00000003628 n=1 Tax=Sungouiella intermedia TaxID=45354 RepID=A0A1L0BDY0_9ASCO|nr:CIC11C00000003628 [[Candida] intermedia]
MQPSDSEAPLSGTSKASSGNVVDNESPDEMSIPEGFEIANTPASSSREGSARHASSTTSRSSASNIHPEISEDFRDSVAEISPVLGTAEPRTVYPQFGSTNRFQGMDLGRGNVLVSGFGSVGTDSNRSGYFHNRSIKTTYTTKLAGTEDELVIVKRQSRSSFLPKDTVAEKPWLEGKTRKRLKYLNWIFCAGIFAGLCVIGVQVWMAWRSITNFDYCEVLIDEFETFRDDIWTREVQVGGFGNGAFDWTTSSEKNSYVKDGKLYILPTLTNETISNEDIMNGYTVNLTADGTCTGHGKSQCWVSSNLTKSVIIPPVQSARLNTKISASMKYGKIEVRAKMPRGDWLWPAIWLLPVNDTYGPWPASGEIDIAESRGNGVHYPEGGYDQISSALHWGPSSAVDGYLQTFKTYQRKIGLFGTTYHTFGLEWSDKYIKTYVDRRLQQVFYHKFNKPFWQVGKFQTTYQNGSFIENPWPLNGANSDIAPFDQEFYLILNVAVGGTNGFFPDQMGNKPWINTQENTAASSFWSSVSSWYLSWPSDPEERAMVVESVKMYKICDKLKS